MLAFGIVAGALDFGLLRSSRKSPEFLAGHAQRVVHLRERARASLPIPVPAPRRALRAVPFPRAAIPPARMLFGLRHQAVPLSAVSERFAAAAKRDRARSSSATLVRQPRSKRFRALQGVPPAPPFRAPRRQVFLLGLHRSCAAQPLAVASRAQLLLRASARVAAAVACWLCAHRRALLQPPHLRRATAQLALAVASVPFPSRTISPRAWSRCSVAPTTSRFSASRAGRHGSARVPSRCSEVAIRSMSRLHFAADPRFELQHFARRASAIRASCPAGPLRSGRPPLTTRP